MKRAIWLVVIFFLAQLLSSLAVLFFFNLPNLLHEGRWDGDASEISPSAMGISLLLNGAVVWAAMNLLGWTDRGSYRLGRTGWPAYAVVVLWMLPVIFLVNLLLESLPLEDLNKDMFAALMRDLWGALAIVLVGPFAEELVFRMGIQRHLVRCGMRPWAAISLSALVFGIVHANPAQIPGTVVMGCILGWLYWRSGTIWMSFVAHVFNNFVSVVMFWCTGDVDTTLVELCGGAGAASLWALAAAFCGYAGYRRLDRMFGKGGEPGQ